MSYVVLGVIEAGMDTNDEVRRRRLARLCRETEGGLIAVASKAGLSPAHLDQIMKKVLLPPKEDGTRSARSLGDQTARQIEAAHGLTVGWLDWPFDAINYEGYSALSDLDKGAVQARMMAAIESLLPDKVDRMGKPDSKVLPASSSKGHNDQSEPAFGAALTKLFESGRGKKNGPSTNISSKPKAATPKKRGGKHS